MEYRRNDSLSREAVMRTVAEQTYTPEDLLAMPDRQAYELVDGHLVERQVSLLSNWVAGQLHVELTRFLREHQVGWAWFAGQGYVCFPGSPRKTRFPDVSFVRKSRLPDGLTSDGYIYIPPDLAVEVISPNDLAYDVEGKILEYLDEGVALVWEINPEARTVRIYRPDGSIIRLREDGELSGEDVLPGFRCRLATIFPEKTTTKPEAG
jgi:Uma2 family endonuclease